MTGAKEHVQRRLRVFYACGPGDAVTSYRYWKRGEELLSEISRTYTGEFFDFCSSAGHELYVVSHFHDGAYCRDDTFTIENRPKPRTGSGATYHLSEASYAVSLLTSIVRWRAEVVIVDSGTTHWAFLAPLKLFGIRVIGSLHNAFWPNGYKPRALTRRAILAMDAWFWRHIADGLLAVSPECERQVRELVGGRLAIPVAQYRAQFRCRDFSQLPIPESEWTPFRILFSGRVEQNKGVFDILAIATALEEERPGEVQFDICGDGSALAGLRAAVNNARLQSVVHIHGRLARPNLLRFYADSHAVIVPTRSDFSEGMPKSCAEAVLSGPPVITSRVSNATDVVPGALVLATPDDPSSYVSAIVGLLDDRERYAKLCAACTSLRSQFLDRSNSLEAALQRVLSPDTKELRGAAL